MVFLRFTCISSDLDARSSEMGICRAQPPKKAIKGIIEAKRKNRMRGAMGIKKSSGKDGYKRNAGKIWQRFGRIGNAPGSPGKVPGTPGGGQFSLSSARIRAASGSF